MLTKLIFPDSFDFGMPTVSLIPIHSRGVDKEFIHKRAALFDDFIGNFEVKPGYAYIHLITVGAGERYGPNNNGDYFNKEARENIAPFPCKGASKKLQLEGGLLTFHDEMFSKHANIYQHHQNRHKGGIPSGYIVKVAMNPEMDRGEMIAGVEINKWESDLQKMASGDPLFFSMGCDAPRDICSLCHNMAKKREDYCHHLKEAMMTIDKNGNQICAITDIPLFHDMSKVVRAADKICFGLRKVASTGGALSSVDLAEIYGMTPRLETVRKFMSKKAADRLELLKKLAEIEKEIELAPAGSPKEALLAAFDPSTGYGDVDDVLLKRLSSKTPEALFGTLKNKLVVLPLDVFMKLIMGSRFPEVEGNISGAKEQLPGIFERLLADPQVDTFLGDSSYEGASSCDRALRSDVESLMPSHSLHNEPVRMRTIQAVLRAEPEDGKSVIIRKEGASNGCGTAEDLLVREYAQYLISFAEGLPDYQKNLTVAQMLANST